MTTSTSTQVVFCMTTCTSTQVPKTSTCTTTADDNVGINHVDVVMQIAMLSLLTSAKHWKFWETNRVVMTSYNIWDSPHVLSEHNQRSVEARLWCGKFVFYLLYRIRCIAIGVIVNLIELVINTVSKATVSLFIALVNAETG